MTNVVRNLPGLLCHLVGTRAKSGGCYAVKYPQKFTALSSDEPFPDFVLCACGLLSYNA